MVTKSALDSLLIQQGANFPQRRRGANFANMSVNSYAAHAIIILFWRAARSRARNLIAGGQCSLVIRLTGVGAPVQCLVTDLIAENSMCVASNFFDPDSQSKEWDGLVKEPYRQGFAKPGDLELPFIAFHDAM